MDIMDEVSERLAGGESEDLTTFGVFRRLGNLRDDIVLNALESQMGWQSTGVSGVEYEFWPTGEVEVVRPGRAEFELVSVSPDLIVRAPLTLLVVEAKLRSPLSGPDQLGKQLLLAQRLARRERRPRCGLLYLTADRAAPSVLGFSSATGCLVATTQTTLEASLASYVKSQRDLGLSTPESPECKSGWTSWTGLARAVESAVGAGPLPHRARILQRLWSFLGTRGLYKREFSGWEPEHARAVAAETSDTLASWSAALNEGAGHGA